MLREVRGKVRVGRRVSRLLLLGDHLELLTHTALDYRIVAVEPERHALAVQYLVADIRFDEPGKLLLGGRPLPARLVFADQCVDDALGHHDAGASLPRGAMRP